MISDVNYSPSERMAKVSEILAEGALASLDIVKGFRFYRRKWEQEALISTVIGPCDVALESSLQPTENNQDKLNNNINTRTENGPTE